MILRSNMFLSERGMDGSIRHISTIIHIRLLVYQSGKIPSVGISIFGFGDN